MDIHSEVIPRIATGFCSGVARTGGTCGAVSGGVMAIGLLLGRDKPGDDREVCYEVVRRFLDVFTTRFGSISCPELTGVHLGTAEGLAEFKRKDQIRLCEEYIAQVPGMVMDLINE